MCHQVVVLDKSNIAPFASELHFVIQEEICLKRSQRSNSGHSLMEVLFFLYKYKREGGEASTVLFQVRMCGLRLCFWTKLISHCLQNLFLLGELPMKGSVKI